MSHSRRSTSSDPPNRQQSKPSGILLALDSDGPGQKATEDNGRMLSDLFRWWGIAEYPGEPDSKLVAMLQRTCDDLATEIQAREALGLPTDQTEEVRVVTWQYMWSLYQGLKKTEFSRATSPEELETALIIKDNPILPTHGRIDYEAIKRNVDIVDYISKDVELRPNGATMKSKCPLPDHDDSTASFYVYPATRSFYCFGCRRGGDVIEYAKLKGVRLGQ